MSYNTQSASDFTSSLNGDKKDEIADLAIRLNLIYSISVGFILVIVFIVVRSRTKWLYSANVVNKRSHPAYEKNGAFSWIWTTLMMADKTLLTFVGLDAFTFLQTIKLVFHILLISSLVSMSILMPIYYLERKDDSQVFFSFSITTLPEHSKLLWIPLVVCVLISLFTYYVIFVHYRNFVLLRQAYVRNPSAITSVLDVIKVKKTIESVNKSDDSTRIMERTFESMNTPSKTVFVTGLPSHVTNDKELFDYAERLNIGPIKDAILIRDTSKERDLQERKQSIIQKLEKAFLQFSISVNKEAKKKDSKLCDFVEIPAGVDVFKLIVEEAKEFYESKNKENGEDENMNYIGEEEKNSLIEIMKDPKFLTDFRKTISAKVDGKKVMVDEIGFYCDELKRLDEEIKFEREISKMTTNLNAHQSFERLTLEQEEFHQSYHRSNITLISFQEMVSFLRNFSIPIKTKSGFLIFEDLISSNILKQCLVDSQLFSCSISSASDSADLIWENLNISIFVRWTRNLTGIFINSSFTILFFLAAMALSALLSLDTLKVVIPGLSKIEDYPVLYSAIKGILTPLALNLLLLLAPMILSEISKFQGVESHSKCELSTMTKYNWFLFINSFIVFLFSGPLIEVIAAAAQGEYGRLIEDFGNSMTKQSVFFINFIIQKALIELVMLLIKPAALILRIITRLFIHVKTPREIQSSKFPSKTEYGSFYPELLSVFPMALGYACISPLTLIAGTVFFGFAYFVVRHEFIFSLKTEYESGGIHWFSNFRHIMMSLIIFQTSTSIVIFLKKGFLQAGLLLLLIIITISIIPNLESIFVKRAEYLPLNVEEEIYINNFTQDFIKKQKEVVASWDENVVEEREETIPYSMIVKNGQKEELSDNSYRNPNMGSSSLIMLPDFFFFLLKFLVTKLKNKNEFKVIEGV